MSLKKFLPVIFMFCVHYAAGQQVIYAANFEDKKIDSSWQIVTGNWRIGDVEELKIAPAESGRRYVLMSGQGYADDNVIRLFVDLPDSLKAKKIKLSFSYYILANVVGTKIESEFYQKEIKDGLRGRLWVDFLYRKKGRWSYYQKTLTVPAGANEARIVFFGFKSEMKDMIICFDNLVVSALK